MTKLITFKAALYAIPLFLAPVCEKTGDFLLNGIWPSYQTVVFCVMLGLIQSCIGLRAYFDGSAERATNNEQQKQNP